ncbi:recombination directionality factor [Streptomyces lydicus]|uniref:recombination directionality factor n=1 Tax=Streptomyces lydicus TaxID=47763 RepID=UPI003790541E
MANNLRRIWETDPEAAPKERPTFSSDIVGRFRSGRLVGKQPEALNEWRVTTGDPTTAARVAELMGGSPEEWETDKEDSIEVLTDSASVEIIIENSSKIDASMKLFGMSGLVHHCDGVEYLSPDEDKGQKCGCPPAFQDRKDRAKSGRGPKPSVDIQFKLADAPDLGIFRFNSGSWELVKILHTIIADVDEVGGADDEGKGGKPVRATLSIENVSYTTKAGRDVSYNKPVVKVTGLAAEAAADLSKAA